MAVDEVLMGWAAATGGCCWRFYRWEEPTLSLGYFQPYEDRRRHAASLDCPVVRRVSGGGAIVHDAELTYSVALPKDHDLAARRLRLYEAVHTTLIEVLSERGVEGRLCPEHGATRQGREPFLCFQRRAPGDVLVGQAKIAGSAQRRTAGSVLQHGSVLLERSRAAPELDGLNDLAGRSFEVDRLIAAWLEKLGGQLGLRWEERPLAEAERREVGRLVKNKFGCEGWTKHHRRQAPG